MFKLIKFTFILFVLSDLLNASSNISKEWLEKQPRSYAKDFYIWRYLNQNITPNEAIWALGEARYVNNKLLYRYAKKLKHKETSRAIKCMRSSAKNLVHKSADCIEAGMSTFKATKLNKKQLSKVIDTVKEKYLLSAKRLSIINSPTPFLELLKSSNKVFYATFNECGGKFRVNNFNHHLPTSFIKQLQTDKKKFEQSIKLIVTKPQLNKIQESLLSVNAKALSHKGTFFLAINAIRHDKVDIALEYLKQAYKKAYFQFDKDKVLYWQYRLTNDKSYLKTLSNSWDVNLYSLIAMELTNKQIKNAIFDIALDTNATNSYDTTNPFRWLRVLKDSKKMTHKKMEKYKSIFTQKETLGHLAFVQERYDRYRNSYFVNPYHEYIKDYSSSRQALINAIARQESRFIPTSISTAYALGVMQIMPFLSKAIAKELKEPYDIDKQLTPKTNLRYAHHHLNFLEKRLNHPLFIAYAYNGGIGFTRRVLKSGLFRTGKYEPFLSMEMIPYDESKRYAKKVLLNYVMYYNNTHEDKIKISTLLQKVKTPYYK
jgi:soluble lytic murein transglycosylase